MKALVTGAAGFIGSHLCGALLDGGSEVVAFDDLSSGLMANLAGFKGEKGFRFIRGDCKDLGDVVPAARGTDAVFHLSGRADVRSGNVGVSEMFAENVTATQTLLEAARKTDASTFVFASSSTVYGEPKVLPTPEDYTPLSPISVYGATKLASEALIRGYSSVYGLNTSALRLANIVGPRSSRGVVLDFVIKLKEDPRKLVILGDGRQRKSYLRVDDCSRALILASGTSGGHHVFNVGSDDQAGVMEIAREVAQTMGLRPKYETDGGIEGGRGWKGDVKSMLLDCRKMKELGWLPTCGSLAAIRWAAQESLKAAKGRSYP